MKFQGSGQGALLLDNAAAGIDEILAGIGRKRMFSAFVAGTAAAANLSVAELRNPAASGKTLYLLFGDAFVATAMGINVSVDGTTLAPAVVPVPAYAGGPECVAMVVR